MSGATYSAYKDSGVEWIGKVPLGWQVLALKHVVSLRSGEQITAEQIETAGEFPVFGGNGLRGYTTAFTHDGHFPLIGRQGALCGNINYAKGKFWASEHAVVVSPKLPCATLWLGELLRSMDLGQYSITAAQPGLSVEAVGNLHIPLPPSDEQIAIAAFLDRETGKIDALVAEQERLMALLKEKQQAVISQAVTKGLDPNVPMKASGVEWLGDIPAHWQVLPLRRLVQKDRRITYGIVQPGEPDERGRFMVRGQDYSSGWASPDTLFRVSDEIEAPYRRARLADGDILMTIVGAGVGNVEIVPQWLDGANITQTTARIAIDRNMADPHFVAAVLQSPAGRRSVELYAKGAAQPGLNLEHVKLFPVTHPPLHEQRVITDFLRTERSTFAPLLAQAEHAIHLLKERRAALISAAVTGKIDVRALAPAIRAAA